MPKKLLASRRMRFDVRHFLSTFFPGIDWPLFCATLLVSGAGLVTMHSFVGESPFFARQLLWTGIGCALLFVLSTLRFQFLRRTGVLVALFCVVLVALALLSVLGSIFQGAQSWFNLGSFSIQPSDPAKIILILILAKYFSRRHIEIAHVRHILVSALYAFLIFLLVLLQPDFGSALIIAGLWFGMVLVSGISKKHLAIVLGTAALATFLLWNFVFAPYQRERIISFLHPLADIQGAGYNAFQSTIAVGSGGLLGKGVGFGTQSKLQFLPEYETDFIFAAFAEEWGFVGVLILLSLYGVIVWRLLRGASFGATNFETFYAIGLALFVITHVTIHVGMNVGLLPVTGTPLPFASYGGSHVLTEFAALGVFMGMRRYARVVARGAVAPSS